MDKGPARPLDQSRAEWYTQENLLMSFKNFAEILLKFKYIMPNESFDPEDPYSEQYLQV